MKKIFATLLFVFILALTGCGYDLTIEESVVQATVIGCEENLYLNYAYEQLARHEADNYVMHNYYMKLAVENATYTYTISVDIDGETYKFVKPDPIEVGSTIELTKIVTSYENHILDIEYK